MLNIPINNSKFYFDRKPNSESSKNPKLNGHYHNMFEIYYMTAGECSYFIDNKRYTLIPGDILLIPEGIIHRTEYTTLHSRSLIICHKSFIPHSVQEILPKTAYLYRNSATISEIDYIFENIENEYNKADHLRDHILTCYTNMLFFVIARNMETCEIVEEKNIHTEKAIEYMKKNFASPITLSQIANICNISPEHFSRIFKTETGINFSEYLNLIRLKEAYNLLSHSEKNLTVTKVATMCGFGDSNYFSSKFKNTYGISPKKFQMGKG